MIDATAYRPPGGATSPPIDLEAEAWESLRVPMTIATVWLYPWSQRPGTVFAHVESPDGLETAHLASGTVEALLEIAATTSTVSLLASPAWPIVDGPTPGQNSEARSA